MNCSTIAWSYITWPHFRSLNVGWTTMGTFEFLQNCRLDWKEFILKIVGLFVEAIAKFLKLFNKFSKRNSCLSSNKSTENMNIGLIIKFLVINCLTLYNFISLWFRVQCFINVWIVSKERFFDDSLHWQYRFEMTFL